MFSPLAQIALTSETRGQNSFVNYSGVNDVPLEKMKTAAAMRKKGMAEGNPEMVAAAKALLDEANSEFQFADQKSLALPAEFTDATQYFKVSPGEGPAESVEMGLTQGGKPMISEAVGDGVDVDFTAKGGNKAVDQKGEPYYTLYRAGNRYPHKK